MCWIDGPEELSIVGPIEPLYIDISDPTKTELVIELSEYLLTGEIDCGSLVYETTISSDTNSEFLVQVSTTNIIILTSILTYPIGTLNVVVNVREEIPNMTTVAAFTTTFSITVVDCFNEVIIA